VAHAAALAAVARVAAMAAAGVALGISCYLGTGAI